MMLRSEANLTITLVDHLLRLGCCVRREVSNMGQSIDVVSKRGGSVTAIEVKLSDWRRGLAQCRAHGLVADFVTLAMPQKKRLPNELDDALRKNGWGLLLYTESANAWTAAVLPKQQKTWQPQRERFLSHLANVTPEKEGKGNAETKV